MWLHLDTHNQKHNEYLLEYVPSVRYVVGFFTPDGKFIWHNGFNSFEEAERMVNYLNGGNGKPYDCT